MAATSANIMPYVHLQAFDDKPLVARILYLFAKLSYAEAQYGQTVNLCLEAQVSWGLKGYMVSPSYSAM